MSLHAHQIEGKTKRTQLMGLENAYHGETALTMSVSDLGVYRKPYEAILQGYPVLKGIPYVANQQDPLWSDCSAIWPAIEAQLAVHQETLSAIIVEPIVQGAAGMRIYAQDFLKRLRVWTQQNGVHLIADEIMTGCYRTGPALASEHAKIEADFVCLGKGLTGGFLPLSAVLTSSAIYALFYDDYEAGKSFLHSHTHSGNALSVSVALAAMEVMEHLSKAGQFKALEKNLSQSFQDLAAEVQCLVQVRNIGGIAAATLVNPNQISRLGRRVAMAGVEVGVLLRPIGNELYWLPPLNLLPDEVIDLQNKTRQALQRASYI
jgi:adenosylmethionine-8-amino-7-oxononanoate aminotransferase